MYRRDRSVVDVSDKEVLYIRWFNDHFDEKGRLLPAHLFVPDKSMNRRKFGGRFWHVLIPDPNVDNEKACRTLGMGILCFQASRVTLEDKQGKSQFNFRVEHDPLDHNYWHCELRLHRDGTLLTNSDAKKLRDEEKNSLETCEKKSERKLLILAK
jgi:hypothetical protein